MALVKCKETTIEYPDFASFEAAEQGSVDKTAQISGIVNGGTVQGWNALLTLEALDTPYDGTNSAVSSGITGELAIRNDNVHFSGTSPIFITGTKSNLAAVRLGAFESVSNITGAIFCKHTGTGSGDYGLATYSGAGGQFAFSALLVERSGAGVWLRGASPSSTVDHMLIVDSSAGQGFRGGLNNESGAEIKNSLSIADVTAGRDDFYGGNYAAASDYLASGDSSASAIASTTSFTGITTAELVDFAGGDFRIKHDSVLADAGEGGTHIGALLEETTPPDPSGYNSYWTQNFSGVIL